MTTTTSSGTLDGLARRLHGILALPGDDLYLRLATPWNVAVATRPVAVVEARNVQDIVESVRYAASAGLAVAVQATGHGISSGLEDTLLVHTGRLDECVVHPDGWARVGAGVRWSQVLEAGAPHGLGGLAGSAPHVGVVGYTTGGGLGPLARTFGFASDHVRAIEVVTGDGELRRTTAEQEPELFWGVRGGKGALGIVTALEFDLMPLSEVYGGSVYFDGEDADSVLHTWATWCEELPEQATTSVALLRLPVMPGVPEPLAGRPTIAVRFVWTGEPEQGDALLAPIRAAGTPVLDGVGVMPYAALGSVHADPVDPMPVHEVSDLLRELPREALDALLAVAGPQAESPQVIVELRQLGGAVARAPRVPSAVSHRDAGFTLNVIGALAPQIAAIVPVHAEAIRTALGPWATGGAFPNFAASTSPERVSRSYDEPTLARLTAAAQQYDPHHLFRVGHVPARPANHITTEENR
jgi:FAD/FMN-containing dehydrogenase